MRSRCASLPAASFATRIEVVRARPPHARPLSLHLSISSYPAIAALRCEGKDGQPSVRTHHCSSDRAHARGWHPRVAAHWLAALSCLCLSWILTAPNATRLPLEQPHGVSARAAQYRAPPVRRPTHSHAHIPAHIPTQTHPNTHTHTQDTASPRVRRTPKHSATSNHHGSPAPACAATSPTPKGHARQDHRASDRVSVCGRRKSTVAVPAQDAPMRLSPCSSCAELVARREGSLRLATPSARPSRHRRRQWLSARA